MDGWDKFLRVILHNTNRQLVYEPKAPSKYPLQCPKILKYSIPDKIETIRDLLFFLPEEEFEVTLNDGMICNDLYEKDLSIYSFPTVNAAHWKRQIYKDGLPDQRYTNYGKFDAQNAAIILEISDAVGLCAKETKSTSNPFVCVYYRNLEWHSKIVKGTVNPKFGFSFPVVLAADEVMNIVVWNIGKKLRFLGQVELGFTDLMELRESKSFKLLKRGRFSHVKGCLNIKTIVLDKTNRSELMEKGLQLVPFDIQEKLKLLIQRIYRLTYKDKKMELLELKAALLKMLKKHWGIQDSELAEYEFEIIAGYYLEDLIPLKELNSCWQKFTSYHDKDSDAARSLKELMTNVLKTILDHFGNFLELMNSAKIGVPKNGKDLQLLVELAEGIEIYVPDHKIDDIPSYFQKSITKSAEIYYQKIYDDLSALDTQFLLLDLTDIIIDNLETLSRNYDILILDRLHPPSIIVNVFYGYLQTRYQDFSSDFDNDWNDLYDILELYKQVRKLQIVSEKIDFKLADKFPMSQWFKPFIEKWFSSSKSKLYEWVLSSFDQDTLEIISADAQHSSSIIDMFTSFQQMVDFIQKLDWPTATENLNFYYAILYDIVSAVGYYCQLTNGFVERDLSLTKGCQPPPPSDSASIGKLKVKLPKMIRKKRIAEQNSKLIQGTRLAPVACVRLLNVGAIEGRFKNLVRDISVINAPPPLPPKKLPAVLPDWSKLTSRKILRISILDGHLKLSKAWSELLAVRINDSQNQEISTTKFVSGSNNPLWNTEILCVVSQDNDDLYVGLVQMVDGKQSINQFEHIPIRGDLGIANPVQKSIIIKQGYLNILLEILPDSPQQLLSTVNYMCAQTREKITNQFSTQITFDFPSRITPLMSKFKQPKMKLFKDNDQYLSNSDIEEIYYLLSPLFEYLNSNFEVIMSSLDEQASLLVIQNIWNKFLQDCQLILVPNLLDTKERKPWEIKRFLFFKKMVEITTEFFQGEGQGLTLEMINSNQYTQLTNIMNHYYDSKEDLMELYFKKEYQEEGLGYLMLLKLKGHLQFVEQQLKNRSSVDV